MHIFTVKSGGLLGLVLVAAIEAVAQMTVPMPKSPHSNVHLKRLTEVNELQSTLADLPSLRASSFVIANNDPRDIIGLCAVWTIVDSSGKSRTSRFTSDRFTDRLNHSILPANRKVVFTPQGWISATPVPPPELQDPSTASLAGFLGSPSKQPHPSVSSLTLADQFKNAESVTLSIDAVIFQDGEVWGPNVTRLDEEIVERKLAAQYISQIARQTMASGGDLKAALIAVRSAPATKSDHGAKWRQRYATLLIQQQDSADIQRYLEYFEALPAPIAFTARQ